VDRHRTDVHRLAPPPIISQLERQPRQRPQIPPRQELITIAQRCVEDYAAARGELRELDDAYRRAIQRRIQLTESFWRAETKRPSYEVERRTFFGVPRDLPDDERVALGIARHMQLMDADAERKVAFIESVDEIDRQIAPMLRRYSELGVDPPPIPHGGQRLELPIIVACGILRRLARLSPAEIAEELGIARRRVAQALSRGAEVRKRLRAAGPVRWAMLGDWLEAWPNHAPRSPRRRAKTAVIPTP
jgi:hypothetical protein